jgi:hypothetical protein
MGFKTTLTPISRDNGRDILAVASSPLGEMLYVDECKQFSPSRKITVNDVRAFLYTIR